MTLGWVWWRAWASWLHTIFHTHLGYTPSLPHTLFHTHTQLFHTQHCHTPPFTHNLFTYNCLTDRSSTTSLACPAFPIPLQLCVLIIGGSGLVGLSGPLIIKLDPSPLPMDIHGYRIITCYKCKCYKLQLWLQPTSQLLNPTAHLSDLPRIFRLFGTPSAARTTCAGRAG